MFFLDSSKYFAGIQPKTEKTILFLPARFCYHESSINSPLGQFLVFQGLKPDSKEYIFEYFEVLKKKYDLNHRIIEIKGREFLLLHISILKTTLGYCLHLFYAFL